LSCAKRKQDRPKAQVQVLRSLAIRPNINAKGCNRVKIGDGGCVNLEFGRVQAATDMLGGFGVEEAV